MENLRINHCALERRQTGVLTRYVILGKFLNVIKSQFSLQEKEANLFPDSSYKLGKIKYDKVNKGYFRDPVFTKSHHFIRPRRNCAKCLWN